MALEEEEDSGGDIPEWVVTFGDMMSLLLTFFIMLVSLSEIKEEERYQAMVDSVRQQFGYNSASQSVSPGRSKPRNSKIAKLASLGRAKRKDTMKGGKKIPAPVGENDRVRIIRPGTVTTVGTVVFFVEGSDELTDAAKEALEQLAPELRGKPQKIDVRGHASLKPLAKDSPFKSPWDLSYKRATNVMSFLVNDLAIEEQRVRISVGGSYEPWQTEPDPEKLRMNARVEVFLLDEAIEEKQTAPASEF
jgi:chemotaxis protein MotB